MGPGHAAPHLPAHRLTTSDPTPLQPPAGLPRILVDLRHEATHNELPSLAALRWGAALAVSDGLYKLTHLPLLPLVHP